MDKEKHVLESLSQLEEANQRVKNIFLSFPPHIGLREKETNFLPLVFKPSLLFEQKKESIRLLNINLNAQRKILELMDHAVVRLWNDIQDVQADIDRKRTMVIQTYKDPSASKSIIDQLVGELKLSMEAAQDIWNKANPLYDGLQAYLHSSQTLLESIKTDLKQYILSSKAKIELIKQFDKNTDWTIAMNEYNALRTKMSNINSQSSSVAINISTNYKNYQESQRILKAMWNQLNPDARKRLAKSTFMGGVVFAVSAFVYTGLFSDEYALSNAAMLAASMFVMAEAVQFKRAT